MFNSLVDRAKDIITDSIKSFFDIHSVTISTYASDYQKMVQDNILGVTRQYTKLQKKLPFIVISTVTGGENIVGFGRGRIRVENETLINSSIEPFNVGHRWEIIIRADKDIYTFDTFGALYINPNVVTAQEIVNILKHQMPKGWWVKVINGTVQFQIDTKEVEVISSTGQLGFPIGKQLGKDYRLVTAVSENLSFSIDVGAESEIVRTQITDLLMFWGEWLRLNYLSVGDSVDLSLAGAIKRGTESVQSFTGGDVYLHLYLNRVEVPMMLYAYENETILMPVTTIEAIQ